MQASRTVRRLRLRAPSQDGVRRVAVGFEDALRTATLPDGGGRILLVRRLSLGRIQRRSPPAQVALALERAFARTDFVCQHGSAPDAGAAPAVWFRDALEAHVVLARRLAAGPPPVEWFWPLAVPQWKGVTNALEGLRRVVLSLATRQEAPAALPEWFAAMARRGHVDAVVAALRPDDLPALARSASLSWRHDRRRALLPPSSHGSASFGRHPHSETHTLHAAVSRSFTLQGTTLDADRRAEAADDADPETAVRRFVADMLAAAGLSRETPSVVAPVGLPEHATPAAAGSREPAIHTTRDPRGLLDGVPTAAGGLLFLLSVFERLGYDDWLRRQHGWTRQEIARRVLQRALTRLRVDTEDPIWTAVVTDASASDPPSRFVAPREWRSGLLSGRGGYRRGTWSGGSALYDPAERLLLAALPGQRFHRLPRHRPRPTAELSALCPLDELVVEAWGVAVRRWLRRCARIGVADVVLRPATLAVTRTHVDLGFDLDRVDLRIRRVGLDLDPGWLPWFGRVVSFHYGPGAR